MVVASTYVVSVSLFVVAFKYLELVKACKSSYALLQSVGLIVMSKELDDEHKEAAVRRAARQMARLSFSLLLKAVLLLGAAIAPAWLADWSGIAPLSQTASFAMRADVLALTLLALYLSHLPWRKV